MTATPLRVVVGEDDVLFREGLVRLLRAAGLEVVAQAGDAEELLRKAFAHRPDVAVVDIRMPPGNDDDGLRAAITLRRRYPSMGVLVLSQYMDASYAVDLIGEAPAGAGYLLKERVGDVESFLGAIRRIAARGSVIDPAVVSRIIGRRRAASALDTLTPREREVLTVMAEGRSNVGVANALGVTEATVAKHVAMIFQKLGLAPARGEHRRVRAVLTWLRDAG